MVKKSKFLIIIIIMNVWNGHVGHGCLFTVVLSIFVFLPCYSTLLERRLVRSCYLQAGRGSYIAAVSIQFFIFALRQHLDSASRFVYLVTSSAVHSPGTGALLLGLFQRCLHCMVINVAVLAPVTGGQ